MRNHNKEASSGNSIVTNKIYDYKNLMKSILLKAFRINLLVIQFQLAMRKRPTYGTQDAIV